MFPDNIRQNIDILVVINVRKNNFGFHSNRKTQGQKHRLNNLYFKYQVCQMKLRHLNTFLQFRLLFHEPHCTSASSPISQSQSQIPVSGWNLGLKTGMWASRLRYEPGGGGRGGWRRRKLPCVIA